MVFYQIYTLDFCAENNSTEEQPNNHGNDDHNNSNINKFLLIEKQFDYLKSLGISHIILNPVFHAKSHGYDTINYYEIDPRLGSKQNFIDFLSSAHSNGFKVIVDIALNHVSDEFVRDKEGELEQWFIVQSDGRLEHFEQHHHLVKLNHNSKYVRKFAIDVLNHWAELGVDGWRLDAAYDGDPHFYNEIITAHKNAFEDSFIYAEMIHGDYTNYQKISKVQSITQYELWKATYSSINDNNFFELAWAIKRDAELGFIPMTFVDNHDVNRIASQINCEEHLAHAIVFWLTYRGYPIVYYGSEYGIHGIKIEDWDGDKQIRPSHDVFNANKNNGPIYRLHKNLINLRNTHPGLINGQYEELKLENEVLIYRIYCDSISLVVGLNLSDETVKFYDEKNKKNLTILPHDWTVSFEEK